jgi:hypothetical protein
MYNSYMSELPLKRTRFTDEDRDTLVDLLLSHKAEYLREFFREHDISGAGNKQELRERILAGLGNHTLTLSGLVDLLDRIEGWGKQHVYMLNVPPAFSTRWRDTAWVTGHLNRHHLGEMINQKMPLILPSDPRLSAVLATDTRIQFVWIEKRTWEERTDVQFRGDEIIRTYRIYKARGITAFDWDLTSSTAMLRIQQLPRKSNYKEKKDHFLATLKPLFDVDQLVPVSIGRSIKNIENADEVDSRQVNYKTPSGSETRFKSSSRTMGYSADKSITQARNALGTSVLGYYGNFYWKEQAPLSQRIHIKIYPEDQRVGMLSQCSESEVRHVLSRIRQLSR